MPRLGRLVAASIIGLLSLNGSILANPRGGADTLGELTRHCKADGAAAESHIDACSRALTLEQRRDWRAELFSARGWHKRTAMKRQDALKDFDAALKLSPVLFGALRGRAVILSDAGRFGEAEQAFSALLQNYETDSTLYLDRGLVRSRAGKADAAFADYTAALAIAPDLIPARVMRARIAIDRRDLATAVSELDLAVATSPDDPAARYWRGFALSEKGEARAAIEDLNRYVARAPRDIDGWLQRGRALERLGNFAGALRSYDRGLKDTPSHSAVRFRRAYALSQLERVDEAIVAYAASIDADARDTTSMLNRSSHLIAKGRLNEAERQISQAFKIRQSDGFAYYVRGMLRFEQRRYADSVRDLGRALALGETQRMQLFNTRGRAFLALKRFGEAAQDFDEVIRKTPRSVVGYFNRALAAQGLVQWEEALAFYQKGLEVAPGDAEATAGRDAMLVKLDRGLEVLKLRLAVQVQALRRKVMEVKSGVAATGPSRAPARRIADYEEALAIDPLDVDSHVARARLLIAENRYAEAEAGAERALEVMPDHASALFQRARARAAQGRTSEGIEGYSATIARAPGMSVAWYNRGLLHKRLTQYDEAVADFGEAIRLEPKDSDYWRQRGLVRREQGKPSEALADLEQALKLSPNSRPAVIDLSQFFYYRREYRAATDRITLAIERGVTNALIWNNRCYYRVILKDLDGALKDCEEAIRIDPDLVVAHHSYGVVRLALGQWDAALESFDEALSRNPKYADAIFGKAIVLKRKGFGNAAEEAFAEARRLNPKIDENHRELDLEF